MINNTKGLEKLLADLTFEVNELLGHKSKVDQEIVER